MTHLVDDGIGLIHTAGQKVRDGVGAAATGVRDGINDIRQHGEHLVEHKRDHKREHSEWMAHTIETVAAAAGALAAFFVSRTVRTVLHRRSK